MARTFLDKFEAVDTTGFPDQEALNKTLMVRNLREQLDNATFTDWQMPINQMNGAHIDLPQLVAILPFDTVKDYDDYVARLKQIPRLLDENIVQMKTGMTRGLMPPKLLLEKVAEQAQEIGSTTPEKSPFARPLDKFPKTMSEADQTRLRQAVLDAVRTSVAPAYTKFTAFVRQEYAPQGRLEPGIWSLPNGDARYAAAAKRSPTTTMTPEADPPAGAEPGGGARDTDAGDCEETGLQRSQEPEHRHRERAEAARALPAADSDEYRGYIAEMWKQLPKLFGRLPKAQLEVMPIEEFNEKTAATHYNQGTPDGSRSATSWSRPATSRSGS